MQPSPPTDEPTRRNSTIDRDQRAPAQSSRPLPSTPSLPGRSSPTTTAANGRTALTSSPNALSSPTNAAGHQRGAVAQEPSGREGLLRHRRDGSQTQTQQVRAQEEEEAEELHGDDTALGTANDREATELRSISTTATTSTASTTTATTGAREEGEGEHPCPSIAAASDAPTVRDDCGESERRRYRLTRQRVGWWDVVTRWWRRQVSVTVEAKGMRDHLALERTFLGYLRTSIALSMTGVVIAQLFRLQHSPTPDPEFGFHVLGKPLAAVFISSAIGVTFLGAFRFWRQQNAMVRGKVHAGGWEILAIMAGSLLSISRRRLTALISRIPKERAKPAAP